MSSFSIETMACLKRERDRSETQRRRSSIFLYLDALLLLPEHVLDVLQEKIVNAGGAAGRGQGRSLALEPNLQKENLEPSQTSTYEHSFNIGTYL